MFNCNDDDDDDDDGFRMAIHTWGDDEASMVSKGFLSREEATSIGAVWIKPPLSQPTTGKACRGPLW